VILAENRKLYAKVEEARRILTEVSSLASTAKEIPKGEAYKVACIRAAVLEVEIADWLEEK
jgi:hypothetical protein